MNNQNRMSQMNALLTQALTPDELKITDDSHLHAGHAGARSGKGHFTVKITSSTFEGKSTLQQHQMVYQALGAMMQTDIHALIIKSETLK